MNGFLYLIAVNFLATICLAEIPIEQKMATSNQEKFIDLDGPTYRQTNQGSQDQIAIMINKILSSAAFCLTISR